MASDELIEKIGFVEAVILEKQSKRNIQMSNLYSEEIEFLEDKLVKVGNYKTSGHEKELQLVDSVLTPEGIRYLGLN